MKTRKIFWGLLFIAIAVFLIASQAGLITAQIGIWSIILGVFFVGILLEGVINRSFAGIFFSLAFLWMIFGGALGCEAVSNWTVLFAALFLTVGCSILFPKKRKFAAKQKAEGKWEAYEDPNKVGEHQKVINEMKNGVVYCSNRFGAATKYINTADLKSANISCSFGELKVYFDNAVIVDTPITIEVHQAFGAMELYIPREWNVQNNINVTLAAVNEKNQNQSTGTPVVNLVGDVSFGEIAIIYV